MSHMMRHGLGDCPPECYPVSRNQKEKMMFKTREPLDLWVPLTDDKGSLLVEPDDATEPEPGSIILTEGAYGTAWQRHFSGSGLWHRAGGGSPRPWRTLIQKRNVILVYDAAVRPDNMSRGDQR